MNPDMLRKILDGAFEIVHDRSSGEELTIICPDCSGLQQGDKTGNRQINLRTGLTNCWKCNQGGHVRSLCYRHGVELESAASSIFDASLSLSEQVNQILNPVKHRRRLGGEASLPDGFTPLASDKSFVPGKSHTIHYELIAEMASRKNLMIEDLSNAGAGYTTVDTKWEPYCIFPVYSSFGPVHYYQGRAYSSSTEPGKLFPSKEECPRGMSNCLYFAPNWRSFEQIRLAHTLVVVESILNVLSLQKKFSTIGLECVVPVATFRAGVSENQWRMLRQTNIREICLLFDSDATDKAHSIASKAARGDWSLDRVYTVAEMPATCGPTTDANDDVDSAINALCKRQKI